MSDERWTISDVERDNIAAEINYLADRLDRRRDSPQDVSELARRLRKSADRIANIDCVGEEPSGERVSGPEKRTSADISARYFSEAPFRSDRIVYPQVEWPTARSYTSINIPRHHEEDDEGSGSDPR